MQNFKKTVYEKIEDIIIRSNNMKEDEKKAVLEALMKLKKDKLNILVAGPTGAGKTSTINAMFGQEIAKVGVGVAPETMEIVKYDLGNMVIWDSPGFGDGVEEDNRHAKKLIAKLNELDTEGNALIDMVLVILDGSSRDMGTSYDLINSVIIPQLSEEMRDRILIAINQADMAMKGRGWDFDKNEPKPELIAFLDEKAASVKRRIKAATGVDVEPIYYSAGFKEPGMPQSQPWNLAKLLYFIVKHTPEKKRAIYMDHTDVDNPMYRRNDDLDDYTRETKRSVSESIVKTVANTVACSNAGAAIGGMIAGPVGAAVGKAIGAVVGFFSSFF